MQEYHVELNSKQYSELERILRFNRDLSRKLAENEEINGYELFEAIVLELGSLRKDGIGIEEYAIPVLKAITAEIYPRDEKYFVRQIGRRFYCDNNFNIKFDLKF